MITSGEWMIQMTEGIPQIVTVRTERGHHWVIASLHAFPDKGDIHDNALALVKVPEMIDALANARSMLSAFRDNSGTVDQIDRILNDIGQGMI